MDQALPLLDECSNRNEPLSTEPSGPALSKYSTRWDRIRSQSLQALKSILPVYLLRWTGGGTGLKKKQSHATAYIDALRGWAAFFVYLYHAWGLPSYWFTQLPFIRVPFGSGAGMVAIFFVISGYVLSYRMLKFMRNHEAERLLEALVSSTFRRFIRLYGSMGIATFLGMLEVQLGWFIPPTATRLPTFLAQLWDWLLDFSFSINPFADIQGWVHPGLFRTKYLGPMWTIPIEYRGSIVLFVFCAASCKLSTRGRRVFLWTVVLLSYYWRAVYVAEFLLGMFIADLSLSRHPERLGQIRIQAHHHQQRQQEQQQQQQQPQLAVAIDVSGAVVVDPDENEKPTTSSPSKKGHGLPVLWRIIYTLLLILGLFLIGQSGLPEQWPQDPFPWPYLAKVVPWYYGSAAYTFWPSIGACLIVFSIDSYPTLQRPFEWSLSQYLGDLSFGIYAMHRLVVNSLYDHVLNPWRARHLGSSWPAYIPGGILTTVLVLWAADYFTRLDNLVIRFARWVQAKTFTKWE